MPSFKCCRFPVEFILSCVGWYCKSRIGRLVQRCAHRSGGRGSLVSGGALGVMARG